MKPRDVASFFTRFKLTRAGLTSSLCLFSLNFIIAPLRSIIAANLLNLAWIGMIFSSGNILSQILVSIGISFIHMVWKN